MPRGVERHVEQPQCEQRRTKSSLFQKGESPQHRYQQQQFDRPGAGRMEAEASELGDVIHDVVVLHVSENMLVEAPAVRVNEGRKQTGQSCYCKISCREL